MTVITTKNEHKLNEAAKKYNYKSWAEVLSHNVPVHTINAVVHMAMSMPDEVQQEERIIRERDTYNGDNAFLTPLAPQEGC